MTADQVARTYDTSIVVRRWLGAWVDFIVLAAIFFIPDLISNRFYQQFLPLWSALALAYFPALETSTGRSVGKYLTGTIVVDERGNRPTIAQSLIRTLFRLLEVNPFLAGGVPAGLAAAFSKTRQRLGDMAAGTYVIKVQHLSLLSEFLVDVPMERLAPVRRAPWAIAAGYLGLCSVILFPAPFAVIAGVLGLRQLKQHPELGGRAGAIFGIVFGALGTALLLWTLFGKMAA